MDDPASTSTAHSCSICFRQPEHLDAALVPSCHHSFCTSCILNWASLKTDCPLCKAPFASLLVQRTLSGSPLQPHAFSEEPLSLLRRATWVSLTEMTSSHEDAVRESVRSSEEAVRVHRARAAAQLHASQPDTPHFFHSELYEDELEASCFEEAGVFHDDVAPQAGQPRRAFGNRRHGPNGYMRSGQMVARQAAAPVSHSAPAGAGPSSAQKPVTMGRRRRKRLEKESALAAEKTNDCPETGKD